MVVRRILAKRPSEGVFNSLMIDLSLQSGYTDLLRITATDFEFLLSLIGSVIVKSNEFRAPISPPEILVSLAHSNTEYVLHCVQRFVVPS